MKLTLAHANDNRPQIDAEFLRIPEMFCQIYAKELLGWASKGTSGDQYLTINLRNPPGVQSLLSAGFQGQATLRLDVVAVQETGVLRFLIRPDGEENVARVRKHCEQLPTIMAAHDAAIAAARNQKRGKVEAVFERIPDYFIDRYRYEIMAVWMNRLREIGPVHNIALREGHLADLSPEPEQGAVLPGVQLKAAIREFVNDTLVVVVTPNDERDERIIRKHCEKMESVGIKPGAQLVEPLRPGMPFMPTISNTLVKGEEE